MFRALIIAAASFTISWQPIPPAENADGVKVYRATNTGIWGLIATIDVPDTFHIDSTAVFNRRYYYVVRSFGDAGLGPHSRIVVGTDFGRAGDPLVAHFWVGVNDSVLYSIHLSDTWRLVEYHDRGFYDALSITSPTERYFPVFMKLEVEP